MPRQAKTTTAVEVEVLPKGSTEGAFATPVDLEGMSREQLLALMDEQGQAYDATVRGHAATQAELAKGRTEAQRRAAERVREALARVRKGREAA
ncbi:MAG: hypothetical protein V1760_02085 [Candidatus Peregrinibacteria bacterium]